MKTTITILFVLLALQFGFLIHNTNEKVEALEQEISDIDMPHAPDYNRAIEAVDFERRCIAAGGTTFRYDNDRETIKLIPNDFDVRYYDDKGDCEKLVYSGTKDSWGDRILLSATRIYTY